MSPELLTTLLIGILLLFMAFSALIPAYLDWYNKRLERKTLAGRRKGSLFAGTFSELSIERIGNDRQLIQKSLRTAITVYPDYIGSAKTVDTNSGVLFTILPVRTIRQTQNLLTTTYPNIPVENLRGYFYFRHDTLEIDPSVWLHYEEDGYWKLLKIPVKSFLEITDVRALLAALSIVSSDEQKLAFSRMLPYVHREIAQAHPVRQRITGDWEELGSEQLYLMPTYLVLLDEQDKVIRRFATEHIWQIEALPRMDKEGEGVLRFRYGEELLSFSLADCEAWASDLALAVSQAQEMPVEADLLEIKKKAQN